MHLRHAHGRFCGKLLAPSHLQRSFVWRNYREHAADWETKCPTSPAFLKAFSGNRECDCIVRPPQSQQLEHEGELGVVIKRRAAKLTDNDDPLSYVLVTLALTIVTARDLQRKDVQLRGRSLSTRFVRSVPSLCRPGS